MQRHVPSHLPRDVLPTAAAIRSSFAIDGGVVSDDTPDALPADRAGVVTGERPATFRDVFALREYRALYLALVASWVAEYLARAAITVLVFQQTRSVVLSAASFAISYLP